MRKAARISAPISDASASSEPSEGHPLVWIALFCGTGLLVSLVAILMGVPVAWD
jgi:hypothetical protein